MHLKVYAALFGQENWTIPYLYVKIRIGTVDGEHLRCCMLNCLFEQKAVRFVYGEWLEPSIRELFSLTGVYAPVDY